MKMSEVISSSNSPINNEIQTSKQVGVFAFLASVMDELRLVIWPTRRSVVKSSVVVLCLCFFFSVLIGFVDYALSAGLIFFDRLFQ